MDLPKSGINRRILALVLVLLFAVPAISWAEDFKVFYSEEYGFSVKYPASWLVEKPTGNYYVVFKSPDVGETEGFRSRIHVAAHQPVKDPLSGFLQELRNGIKDLQKNSGGGAEGQNVRIVEEGEFACNVPGAYYFYIQAYEPKINIWMDIVIVFYKHEQTLLRVSCLTPSKSIDKLQPLFNETLVSLKFGPPPQSMGRPPQPAPSERPSPPGPPPGPSVTETPVPSLPAAPAPTSESGPTETPPAPREYGPSPAQPTPPPPAPAPPARRAPVRDPDKPGTGIVN
jgi:hypothetical protein